MRVSDHSYTKIHQVESRQGRVINRNDPVTGLANTEGSESSVTRSSWNPATFYATRAVGSP